MEMKLTSNRKENYVMDPVKFNMWLFLASIMMIFMSLTSAYIVRRAEGNWEVFATPMMFYVSSGLIILSSISLHWAYLSAKKNELVALKSGLLITLALGAGFVYSQWQSWNFMVENNLHFSGNNVAASFLYVISGVHALHVIGGILFLLATVYSAFRFRVHSKEMKRISLCTTYWHVLGGLWLYLHFFLMLFR